jgi:hypothetical protein
MQMYKKIIKTDVMLTGKIREISIETHHKAEYDVINENQPICSRFPKIVLI